ncbi:MAG: hypothetical protein KatS3mg035_0142 [Bacteroidia bacterium]|nr:MAG: hypothetical protein KatS3mg035_0142 [Bacteroidia bacterium]
MLALFNLIKTLSKEEKRLYSIYGKNARYSNIYHSYLESNEFYKTLDNEIYEKYYSDTSKAYFSMQKRELYEDILSVLLERSNINHPYYQFYKSIAKMGILLHRNLPESANEYAKSIKFDIQQFSKAHQNLFYELLFLTYENSTKASFLEFINFLNSTSLPWDNQRTLLTKIKLLNLNLDQLDIEKIQNFAKEIYQEIQNIAEPNLIIKMAGIQALILQQDHENAHRELTRVYMSHFKDVLNQKEALDCLSYLMKSCLKNGDFLLMNSILYKTESKLHTIPEELKTEFLLSYYEYASLFHFYENELPTALKEIQYVIDHSKDYEKVEKSICYRMAMLVAGDLQYQLTQELSTFSTKYPQILNNPYIIICDILASINNQVPKKELDEKIEKLEIIARQNHLKNILAAAKLLSGFIYQKKNPEAEIKIFPPDWEPILLVHLWIKAKIHRIFYYNLVVEEWLKKRKVF